MKVHWTHTAEEHLDAIYTYIALDSPAYAKRMVDRLTRKSEQITGTGQKCAPPPTRLPRLGGSK